MCLRATHQMEPLEPQNPWSQKVWKHGVMVFGEWKGGGGTTLPHCAAHCAQEYLTPNPEDIKSMRFRSKPKST